MLTMQKEKVNTHFSFPMKLDMSGYVEKTLLPQQYQESKSDFSKHSSDALFNEQHQMDTSQKSVDSDSEIEKEIQYEYNLIGVTVHTGNADGGHYYSFIKERNGPNSQLQDRWFLFNDAEVKQFDPSQIEAECFGGEMTSKTYDTVTEKYLDFSFEKTNSAYMLFYERCAPSPTPSDSEMDFERCSLDDVSKFVDNQVHPSCSRMPNSNQPSTNTSQVSSSCSMKSNTDGNISDASSENSMQLKTQNQSIDDNSATECDIDTKGVSNCYESSHKATENQLLTNLIRTTTTPTPTKHLLNKELEEWIWEDNRYFLQDRNIFEHTYFK